MHSLFIHPVLISLSVPFLILWHRDMSVGRRSSLRMLECPPVQGSVEDRVTVILTEEIHTIIGRVARCGVNTRPNQGWNVLHVSLLPSCMSPLSPASSSLSVYCIHGELRDIALKTRLVTIRRNILSLNLKIFCKSCPYCQKPDVRSLTNSAFTEDEGKENCKLSQLSLSRAEVISFKSLKLDLIFIFKMFCVDIII